MVANRCKDLLRKHRRASAWLAELGRRVPAVGEEPGSATEEATRRQSSIEGLLGRLPSRQAEVLRLRVYGELPFEAVAQVIGCSVPTVKSRFRYGVQKLRRALKRQGGER
jgi:RNA polymerase sigma-70 factor (ECF subfamily)